MNRDPAVIRTMNLPTMQSAFRTTSVGGQPRYVMTFAFASLDDLNAADAEWRAVCGARQGMRPEESAEETKRQASAPQVVEPAKLTPDLVGRTMQAMARVITDEQIDAICAPGRASRWKCDGRQYDRDTVRLVLARLADEPTASQASAPSVQVVERDTERIIEELGQHHAAVQLARSLGYEWRGGKWQASAPSVPPNPYDTDLYEAARANGTLPEVAQWAREFLAPAPSVQVVLALESLVRYVERNECQHEETHRGGAIWTICDGCGKQWADDRGGFEPYKAPAALEAARAALAQASALPAAQQPANDIAAAYRAMKAAKPLDADMRQALVENREALYAMDEATQPAAQQPAVEPVAPSSKEQL